IDIDHGIPFSSTDLIQWLLEVHRRHVDKDVDSPELVGRGIDEPFTLLSLSQVSLKHRRSPTCCAHALGGLFGLPPRAPIAQRNVDSPAGKSGCDNGTDALRTSDEGDLVLKIH